MTPRKDDDDGNLLNKMLPSDTDYELLANLIFDNAPDNKDGAKARAELKRICNAVHSRFKVPSSYGNDDHYQDVSLRFFKSLPHHRGEAKLGTLVYRIAVNQLIDMRRRGWSRESPESLLRDDEKFFDLLEQQLARNQNVNGAAEAADRRIHEKELLGCLTKREYVLYRSRFVLGKTAPEIAEEEGVSRQAISKKLTRIVAKIKRKDDETSSELSDFSDVVAK